MMTGPISKDRFIRMSEAVRKIQKELKAAKQCIGSMAESRSPDDFEQAWQDFLTRLERA